MDIASSSPLSVLTPQSPSEAEPGSCVRDRDLAPATSCRRSPLSCVDLRTFLGPLEVPGRRVSLSSVLEDNPLVDFVELPDTCQGLYYCNVLSGVIRGALEMVSMKTEITWTCDVLRGDDVYELQVKLLKQVPEEYPYKDDE